VNAEAISRLAFCARIGSRKPESRPTWQIVAFTAGLSQASWRASFFAAREAFLSADGREIPGFSSPTAGTMHETREQ
jgi:hypothetical protein